MAADSEDCFRSIEVFWSKDATDTEDNNMAYVPGILAPGNRRPTKITARKTREVKAAIPRKQPKVEELPICGDEPPMRDKVKTRNTNNNNNKGSDNNHDKEVDWADRGRKASLKDLCNEDKKRVADLIRELARVGDEKEGAMKQLQEERRQFEKHITDVLGQQEALLKEREGVQTQLLACQALLLRYQQLVSEQQEKVSVVSSEATTKRTEDKAVNSSFTLSSPRSDCATSERKAELYSPRKPSKPASVKSYEEVPEEKGVALPPSQHQPACYALPPGADPRLLDGNRLLYSCQQVAPPPFISAPPLVPEPMDGRFLLRHQHNCYCPYHNLEQVPSHTMQGCTSYQNCTTPPSGDMQHRSDGTLPGQRPFTKVIDQEIAKERQIARPPAVSEERLFGIGPLSLPTMSSTQRSDYGSIVPGHDDATDGVNFEPLRPESAHSSTQDGTQGHSCDNNNVLPGGTTSVPENLTEDEFIRYYQQLTPAERKRQLQTQKAALLKEQQYLRKVLSEQERLLSTKQEQLHKQQSVQRQRLEYFEQNGHFPSVPPDRSTNSGDKGVLTRSEARDCEEGAKDREEEVNDLVRQRLDELRLQDRVAPSATSFRNRKSASAETYSSVKRSSETSSHMRRTVSVATSPMRSSELGRERQGKRHTRHSACDVDNSACHETLRSSLKTGLRAGTKRGVPTRITPKQLSVSLPTCDDSVTSLLDIVDEVESLHDYTNNNTSATKQHSRSIADVSLPVKQPNASWSELDMSDSLEESRVLEDVFFVK